MSQASTYPSLIIRAEKGPHIQPNNQLTISSIITGSTSTSTDENQLLHSLQAKVATLSPQIGKDNPHAKQALLTATSL